MNGMKKKEDGLTSNLGKNCGRPIELFNKGMNKLKSIFV